jgi:hypothetical protein
MLFKYAAEGAEPRQWTYSPDKLMSSEAEAIEKVTHLTYQEFGMQLLSGSVTARRALLWVMLKRTEPTLRHGQVDFPAGAVELEYEPHELKAIRDKVAEDASLADEDRIAALDQLDTMIGDAEVAVPKAPASVDATSD